MAQAGRWLIAGLFLGILAFVAVFSLAVGHLGRRVRRLEEGVAYVSGAILLAFAAWVGLRGLELLGRG